VFIVLKFKIDDGIRKTYTVYRVSTTNLANYMYYINYMAFHGSVQN
jgi:hypothetical protein